MKHYNIFIEDIYGIESFLIGLNEGQLNRALKAYRNGEDSVIIMGKTIDLNENKNFVIYSISNPDLVGKTQEQIIETINRENKFFEGGRLSEQFLRRYGANITDDFTNGSSYGEFSPKFKPTNSEVSSNKKMDGKIFISHSSKDSEIVIKFCDLILGLGLNINTSEEIFNTSMSGSKPKTGEDFRNRILEELVNSKVVLQFISKEYKASGVCMNEMGAAWVISKNVKPLIIDSEDYDIGFIHSTNQQAQLHNESDILKLIDELKSDNIIKDFKSEVLSKKVNEFVNWLKSYNKRDYITEKYPNKKESFQKTGDTIAHNINKEINPFYKLNKRASTYYLRDSKYCLIPDMMTLLFLGYRDFNTVNYISIAESEFNIKTGQPIVSVTRGAILKDEQSNEFWLSYENKRHLIDEETNKALNKENPAIKNIKVNRNQLLQIVEGDFFSIK
ncbi:MAG: toll/interleukin-1 receptor domain-containing protein [Bacteroidetes bacterium]|nr:toll/interleukin-1 receptor domain-containing protein [Bacteroidota bacterium]